MAIREFNVTYYLGAGASANSLPTVSDLSLSLIRLAKKIRDRPDDLLLDEEVKNFSAEKKQLIGDLAWLAKYSNRFESVDTFAKHLFLIKEKEKEYKKLKATLSAFFMLSQANQKPDHRYESFWISLLERDINLDIQLPPFVNVITWNYDIQPELTLMKYQKDILENSKNEFDRNYLHRFKMLNSFSAFGSDLSNEDVCNERFFICHLNGTAATYPIKHFNLRQNFLVENWKRLSFDNLLALALFQHNRFHHEGISCELAFCWEEESKGASIPKTLVDSLEKTDCVVVIGYSFPFFNRKIDRQVFQAMKNLKKVYLQVLEKDFLSISSQLNSIHGGIPVNQINDIRRFYFPMSL